MFFLQRTGGTGLSWMGLSPRAPRYNFARKIVQGEHFNSNGMENEMKLTDKMRYILLKDMPDGCSVSDYLDDCVPNKSSLIELGINVDGYGLSDIRADIYEDFKVVLLETIISAIGEYENERA